MQSFKYTIEDIQSATGLTRKLIDRCFRGAPEILRKYRQKTDGNKWWYDHGAVEIFQRIAVMKQNGRNFPEIKRWLEDEFGDPKSGGEEGREVRLDTPENRGEVSHPSNNEPPIDHTGFLISTLNDSHQRELETKDQMIGVLSGNLKLLEEGRERREKRETNLMEQVKALNTKITTEEERGRQREERRRQRKALYSKLATLNGWRKGKEREAVLKEIEVMDNL